MTDMNTDINTDIDSEEPTHITNIYLKSIMFIIFVLNTNPSKVADSGSCKSINPQTGLFVAKQQNYAKIIAVHLIFV